MPDGIVKDFFAWLVAFLNSGHGFAESITTNGSSRDTPFADRVTKIIPALTIFNNGPNAIKIGVNGKATFPLASGAAYTFRWKNPANAKLCYNDLGFSLTDIEVIS